jgi:hypothetical protein
MNGKVETALETLAQQYHVSVPKVKVGLPKGRRKKILGCYNSRSRTISVLNSCILSNPSVILHEFYHHLRTSIDAKHRGTERHANEFTRRFIQAYQSMKYENSEND